jgi:hypothetical protein
MDPMGKSKLEADHDVALPRELAPRCQFQLLEDS